MNNIFAKDLYTGAGESPLKMRAAIYCRLSKDDEKLGESESIQNQKAMLEFYCKQQDFEVVKVYQDDGFTGMNMNRPDVNRMLRAVESKQFDVVLTKDLSRLSRDYLEIGRLVEEFFPRNSVRYIAVNDSFDSNVESSADFMPFRAVVNQMYSADTSKKIHSAYLSKAQLGKFTGCIAPFGYKKNPLDKNHLLPDEETAGVVKQIFAYAREGFGANYIRKKLEEQEIPTPSWWNRQRGFRESYSRFERENPETGRFIWSFSTINELIQNPVYIGAIASQKQVYKFKTGWIKDKDPCDWLIVENTHEPLIDRETFDLAQKKLQHRKRPDAFGNYNIFAAMVFCGQCGSTMNVRTANKIGNEKFYNCSKYNKYGAKHCGQHYFTYDKLYSILLEQIRFYAGKALEDEAEVLKRLTQQGIKDGTSEQAQIKQSISEGKARLQVIENMIAKLYEDYAAERINSDNMNTILAKTQAEQHTLKKRMQQQQARLDSDKQEKADTDKWLALIKEYADITELDTTVLHRLIQKVVVHEEVKGGVTRQTVEIHFNFMSQPHCVSQQRKRSPSPSKK